ncbi:HlyC/CorC family transporter [Candidatus Woesearchaeota archaeon]|nr:HlyC/CorC family transporter [Candidatus Woesearchaeota archaeon]
MIWDYLALGILVALSAFFSCTETAFTSLSRIRIRQLVREKIRGAKTLEAIKNNPRKLLTTLLVGNNIVNIAASSIATYMATTAFGSNGVGIATGIMTLIILTFGEIIPKSFALHHAEKMALLMVRPVSFFIFVLRPVTILFGGMTTLLLGPPKSKQNENLISEEMIRSYLKIGVEEKTIEKKEKEFIEGVLRFKDITVVDIMTHRTKIFCLAQRMTIKQALSLFTENNYSRVPIYSKTRDNITGIVFIKDIMKEINEGNMDKKLHQIASSPIFVPKTTVISNLFRELKKKRTHMAIVVDEHGGTAGLVTLEDIIEQIVGEIRDETDVKTEFMKRLDSKTLIVEGNTGVREVNEFFQITIPAKDTMTISAFILAKLKKIPQVSDTVDVKDLSFEIIEMGEKNIQKVSIKKR